jgi:hypothetical protein
MQFVWALTLMLILQASLSSKQNNLMKNDTQNKKL